ncbi:TSP1 domain-containing TSP10 precursor [Cryptosporidium xiaoi]|uniref:TSP1 domain-containing TSP10 n=1 Tax=Cryptosporidium xiaoi TaxID=659607 RepID=A0AAV9Y1N8_9CRYT
MFSIKTKNILLVSIICILKKSYCQMINTIRNPEGGEGYTCMLSSTEKTFNCKVCNVSTWNYWETCSECNGKIKRTRTLTTILGSTGTCPVQAVEQADCLTNEACEICNYSEWSEWSACSDTYETGTKYRTRSVDSNNECMLSDELLKLHEITPCGNSNSICNELLEGTNGLYYRGCQKYSRTGQKCLNWLSLNLDAFNYLSTLENSGIGDHSFCRNPISNNTLIPTIWCYVSANPLTPQLCDPIPTDCIVSEWSQWSTCSVTCETGKSTRERTIIQEALNDGEECPTELSQVQDCTVDVICPVDCVLGSWTYWSACSAECGEGNSTRSRSIITKPKGTGQVCKETSQRKLCEGENCQSFWKKNKYILIAFGILGILLIASIIYILIPRQITY